jgi:hypothetical protein
MSVPRPFFLCALLWFGDRTVRYVALSFVLGLNDFILVAVTCDLAVADFTGRTLFSVKFAFFGSCRPF